MYKLTQHYSHITVQKYLHIQATCRQVSVPATTTIITMGKTIPPPKHVGMELECVKYFLTVTSACN